MTGVQTCALPISFKVTLLTFGEWLIVIALSLAPILIVEIYKAVKASIKK